MLSTIVFGIILFLASLSIAALSVAQIPKLWRWGKKQWVWDTSVGRGCKSGPTEKLFAVIGTFWGTLILLLPMGVTGIVLYGIAINL